MKTILGKKLITIMAVIIAFTGLVHADEMDSDGTILFTGTDNREDADYYYIGLIHHFSGNILSDGFMVRAMGSYADYEYNRGSFLGDTDGDATNFDVMLGYQKVMEHFSARAFVGFEYEDHDLSPNNSFDDNRGTHLGVKVQGELETDFASPAYGSLLTSYGSANGRYYTRLRGGYEFSGFVIGPEVSFLGDQEYNEQRYGAFITARRFIPVMFSLSAGYADPDSFRGDSSYYFAFGASFTF